jgi:hypothetical protein
MPVISNKQQIKENLKYDFSPFQRQQFYHAFCLFKHHKVLPVTYFQFQKVLKSLIKSIGKDTDEYSSHNFRRGGTSWAFSAEVPSELIQLYGDWSSDSYGSNWMIKLLSLKR